MTLISWLRLGLEMNVIGKQRVRLQQFARASVILQLVLLGPVHIACFPGRP